MSQAALQRLDEAQTALAVALETRDIDALEALLSPLAQAVGEIAAAGGWRESAHLRDELRQSLKQAEAVRGRINMLADRNRRQFDRLISLAGAPRPQAYGRNGRLG